MGTVFSFIPQIQVVALIDSFIHLHLYDILADVIVPFQGGGVWFPLFNQNCHFYLSFLVSGGLPRPLCYRLSRMLYVGTPWGNP